MSNTPETDHESYEPWKCYDNLVVSADFASRLEKERNSLKKRLAECEKDLAMAIREIDYLKANPGKP